MGSALTKADDFVVDVVPLVSEGEGYELCLTELNIRHYQEV